MLSQIRANGVAVFERSFIQYNSEYRLVTNIVEHLMRNLSLKISVFGATKEKKYKAKI